MCVCDCVWIAVIPVITPLVDKPGTEGDSIPFWFHDLIAAYLCESPSVNTYIHMYILIPTRLHNASVNYTLELGSLRLALIIIANS